MIERTDFNGLPIDLDAVRRRVSVSDRALLDYVRITFDIDVERLRKALVTDAVLQAMAMGATAVRGDGFKLIIHDLVVIGASPATALTASLRAVGDR